MTKLVARKEVQPDAIAAEIYGRVVDIEKAIKAAESNITAIENRGFIDSIFSSDRDDMVSVSRSQNRINDLMLKMINDIIALNVMSYTVLVAVMADFERRVAEGVRDANGRVIRLSTVGKDFADSATAIFARIIDGSRDTKEKIALNASQIESIRKALNEKARVDAQQDEAIQAIHHSLDEKEVLDEAQSGQIASIQAALVVKDSLDTQQSEQLASLGAASRQHVIAQEAMEARIAALGSLVEQQASAIRALEAELATMATSHATLAGEGVVLRSAVQAAHVAHRGRGRLVATVLTALAGGLALLAARVFGVI